MARPKKMGGRTFHSSLAKIQKVMARIQAWAISRETNGLTNQNGPQLVPRNPRGQQRDKIYREALRLELADMSERVDLKNLRQIARAHIEKAASGDMQAIRELADRLDGRQAQTLEHNPADSEQITKVSNEVGHVHETGDDLVASDAPVLSEWREVRDVNGSGGQDTARTKR